jgi:hypothetical protein
VSQELKAAGVLDQAQKIDWSKARDFFKKLLDLLAQEKQQAAPKALAPGCCDHNACCDKVIAAQLTALQAACEHKAACCQEAQPSE